MTEGVNSAYNSYVQSNDERQQLLEAWRDRLEQARKNNSEYTKNLLAKTKKDSQKEQTFQRNQISQREQTLQQDQIAKREQTSAFLQNSDIAEREQPFLSMDVRAERDSVFLANEINAERTSPFLTNEVNPDNQPFLAPQDRANAESPLALRQTEEQEEELKANDVVLPKNTATILSELKRNPMHSVLTARDIANQYEISYQEAIDLFKALNADANGIAQEFNLPDQNATVSYLV